MFTGIVEGLGEVVNIQKEGSNIHFTVKSDFANELQIDQSVAHNGTCLTVVGIQDDEYIVTAIKETLDRTNLGHLSLNDEVNLERCTKIGHRLDGHIVQGHVDCVAECYDVKELDGSTEYYFNYTHDSVTVEKGSVTVNGVSLTVVMSKDKSFSVAIIPYTKEHTTFKYIEKGTKVNLEFDIVGKYVEKLLAKRFE